MESTPTSPAIGDETQVPWLTHPRWEAEGEVAHLMTTRLFARPETSREEVLAQIRQALGVPRAVSVVLDQVHGRRVATVDERMLARAEGQVLRIAETDAAVTALRGVLLHVFVADCVPVLAFDPAHHVVGVAHAGWRGTVKKIAAALVRAMAACGANPGRTEVWLGPSICQGCFEVGPEVLRRFTAVLNWWPAIHLSARRVDLALVNRLQLARAGVPPDHMTTSPLCTRCRVDLLHSHRAEPANPGRMAAVIGLRG